MYNIEEIKATKDAENALWPVIDKHDRRCLCDMCEAWLKLHMIAMNRPFSDAKPPRRRVGRPVGK